MGFITDIFSPSAPSAPDPRIAINAEAQANRVNQITPFGTLIYEGPNNETSRIRLPPNLKDATTRQMLLASRLSASALNRHRTLPVGPMEGAEGLDPANIRSTNQDAERALFDRSMSLLAPGLEERERALEQRLANQGLPVGSEAFTGEMDRSDRQRNELELAAALQAVIGGQAEGRAQRGELLGRNLQGINLDRTARSAQFNELASILGMNQVQAPGMQSFVAPGNVNTGQAFGAQQAGQLAGFNAQQQANQGLMGGLFGLGSTALLGGVGGLF